MNVASFNERLQGLSAEDIRRCAARLRRDEQCVADQVSQWRAELAIDRLIRRQCSRPEAQRATAAAQQAARLVLDVARRRGIPLPDGDISRVARTAGQVARALSLGAPAEPFLPPLLVQLDTFVEAGTVAPLTAA